MMSHVTLCRSQHPQLLSMLTGFVQREVANILKAALAYLIVDYN